MSQRRANAEPSPVWGRSTSGTSRVGLLHAPHSHIRSPGSQTRGSPVLLYVQQLAHTDAQACPEGTVCVCELSNAHGRCHAVECLSETTFPPTTASCAHDSRIHGHSLLHRRLSPGPAARFKDSPTPQGTDMPRLCNRCVLLSRMHACGWACTTACFCEHRRGRHW